MTLWEEADLQVRQHSKEFLTWQQQQQDEQPLAPLHVPPAILEDLITLFSSQRFAVSCLELRSPSPIQTSCSQFLRWVWGIPACTQVLAQEYKRL